MKNDKIDKNMLGELIENLRIAGFKEFYLKNEFLEIKGGFPNTINHKDIISNEVLDNNGVDNNEVLIRSEYVAKIKLKNEKNFDFINKGDKVKKGTKLAEYKYLNISIDLNSPCNGSILEIYINHNDVVDYNKKLFLVKSF